MSVEPYEDERVAYKLAQDNEKMAETIQDQWADLEEYDLAVCETSGVLGDMLAAYYEFIDGVEAALARYKKALKENGKMDTLEDVMRDDR